MTRIVAAVGETGLGIHGRVSFDDFIRLLERAGPAGPIEGPDPKVKMQLAPNTPNHCLCLQKKPGSVRRLREPSTPLPWVCVPEVQDTFDHGHGPSMENEPRDMLRVKISIKESRLGISLYETILILLLILDTCFRNKDIYA